MTSIIDVQEGKGAFFTKDDIVDKEIILVDDRKLSDQVPTHKGQGDAANTDYYEFNISVDGVVKQIGITYTNMKDMVKLLPSDIKNIQGCRFKYDGEKGKGKNIKYLWTYLGIAAKGTYAQQTTIPQGKTALDEPTDASGQLLKALSCSTAGVSDTEFWKHVEHLTGGNLAGGMALVQHLREKGQIFQDKDGFWSAGK